MANLTKAHEQLFNRAPDERFNSLPGLWEHCQREKQDSQTRWYAPVSIKTEPDNGQLTLLANEEPFAMTDWSFSQLCKLAEVSKDTVNQLSPQTASHVFQETLPRGSKPLQVFALGRTIRSVHGVSYTRLYNADVLGLALEFVTDFEAPQEAMNGGTGLYCGEQDMFAFLIDPTGWTEIEGQAFAPGFFLWNSEVGRRSVGVQTFWFQAVCQNHIVWDAVEVIEFTRKHTTNVHEALENIRTILHNLTKKRDKRRQGFVRIMKRAMGQSLDPDMEQTLELVCRYGVRRALAQRAIEHAKQEGALTIFSLVDALTRMSQDIPYAGDRAAADATASQLLALAA
ncbi:MAG: DUF932 domain-containing protein [Candidatus Hydrogenedentota bacterium]